MDIDKNSPDMEHPLVNVHEYRGILQEQQTINHKEMHEYFATVNSKPEKVDAMLEDLFHQPAMESVYRRNGIEPGHVDDFIAQIKKFPEIDKRNLLNPFYAAYAYAAKAQEGFVDGISSISGKEWDNLPEQLMRHLNIKHLQWKIENGNNAAENIVSPDVAPIKDEKVGFGKKIMRWFEKRKISIKGMKSIAAGVAAAVVLSPAAMKLLNLTADKDNAKIAKTEQKAPQSQKQSMAKVYDMSQDIRS